MSLVLVGTNHKYSPIEIREKLCFSKGKIREALPDLVGSWVKAGVILSTCNRVELYASSQDIDMAVKALKTFLADYHRQDLAGIEPYLYTYVDKDALYHLFKVSSGIDSQIVGETQILGQVRFAFEEAQESGCIDKILNNVFSRALEVGQKVRSQTRISAPDVSIAGIAMSLIKEKAGALKDKKILIIGVSKISGMLVNYLKQEEAAAIFISNRTFEKSEQLAGDAGGIAVKFDRLKEKLKEAQVIISATASPHWILKKQDIFEAQEYRASVGAKTDLLVIDLALPRDVEPQVKDIKGVKLYCLDDLTRLSGKNLSQRKDEIPKALNIIRKEAQDTWTQLKFLEWEPAAALLP